MKIGAVFIVLSLLVLPLFVTGVKVDRFQGWNVEAIADISGPGFSAIINITIPAECYVLNATMNVTGMAAAGVLPMAPEVVLNNTVLWAFNGTGYGAMGRQDLFSDGTVHMKTPLDVGGGKGSTAIRLPKDAVVRNATLDVDVSGPMVNRDELVNFTDAGAKARLGYSVSNAGDVNNDGYADVIVGAPFYNAEFDNDGHAYIYFGGPAMDSTPDVTFTGEVTADYMGVSVSTAGDVNQDGYADVLVGALGYNGGHSPCENHVHLYFGGAAMDNISDSKFTGDDTFDLFGTSVSTAGDVNNDGYDDMIVGASYAYREGQAYIYYGDPQRINNARCITYRGAATNDHFGCSVSNAGDVNNDGYDDVIVGAMNSYAGGFEAGRAYIFYGHPAKLNVSEVFFANDADMILNGSTAYGGFGCSVSSAGDMNDDGFDDVIVGAMYHDQGGTDAGRAYIYFGGAAMDTIPDMTYTGAAEYDKFGSSVSTAGDINKDGYDDVIVGTIYNNSGGHDAGRAYIYFGGYSMDNVTDFIFTGAAENNYFGRSVSNAGDVNNDGFDDVIVGADGNDSGGDGEGHAYIYSPLRGLLNSNITAGLESIWNKKNYFNGTDTTNDFSYTLNEYLRSATPTGRDNFGNSFVDVPISVRGDSEGNIDIFHLDIIYEYNATVPDFASPLNMYILSHKGEKDVGGNLTIPVTIRSITGGKLKLSGLNITYDGTPMLVKPIPDMEMDEDSINNSLLDLFEYFQDDLDLKNVLGFSVEDATYADIVHVGISDGHSLSADALTGDANDNWTGVVVQRILCRDSHGSTVVSNSFNITIRNVNDPPIITSRPNTHATAFFEYVYQVIAVDGDNDTLTFKLQYGPMNMTVSTDGGIRWGPSHDGIYNVSVSVGDGQATAIQNFSINVTGNHPPTFTSIPVTNATVGMLFLYNASASDFDQDFLVFSLEDGPDDMRVDPATGEISWTPALSDIGNHTITVRVYDGCGGVDLQTFTIMVIEPQVPLPVAPRCLITFPANGTLAIGKIQVRGTSIQGSALLLAVFVRIDNGNWAAAVGLENWSFDLDPVKLAAGKHRIDARAFDGNLSSETASVEIIVNNPEPRVSSGDNPWCLPAVIVAIAAGLVIMLLLRKRIIGPR